jgi:hypothetical protein
VLIQPRDDRGDIRPRFAQSAEGRRIERAVTIATVLEFAAAIVLPVIVSAAGHSDWVLPSIDHRVSVPRYRPVGWALTIGPVILAIALPGTALGATSGLSAGILLLATAVASGGASSPINIAVRNTGRVHVESTSRVLASEPNRPRRTEV